jgi:hypothetical protein
MTGTKKPRPLPPPEAAADFVYEAEAIGGIHVPARLVEHNAGGVTDPHLAFAGDNRVPLPVPVFVVGGKGKVRGLMVTYLKSLGYRQAAGQAEGTCRQPAWGLTNAELWALRILAEDGRWHKLRDGLGLTLVAAGVVERRRRDYEVWVERLASAGGVYGMFVKRWCYEYHALPAAKELLRKGKGP